MNFLKNWKRISAMLCIGLLLLTGCAQEAVSDAESAVSPDNPITLTVWVYYNKDQLASFNRLVDEFNATQGKEQGILVECSSLGTVNDLETNVLAAVEGKVGAREVPNIFSAYTDTAYAVDQMGLLVDISQYMTEQEMEQFVPSYLQEGAFSNDGSIKILPVAKSTEVFMLNKTDWDIFAEATGADLEDLATIEGMAATAQKYYEWTDSLTPELNDGKAFVGRDAQANYFFVGAMQLGRELLSQQDGMAVLQPDRDIMKKLWDYYYIPYIKGYFSSSLRFRSDDVKTGEILGYIGSSSGATFFPKQVIINDEESYPIAGVILQAPIFSGCEPYAVQQGAGMAVIKTTEEEAYASMEFLKWFTQADRNISFSVDSGYMPVKKEANDMDRVLSAKQDISDFMQNMLTVSIYTANHATLYTPPAVENGTEIRAILNNALNDIVMADREAVKQSLAAGMTLEQAIQPFVTEEYFDAWYAELCESLESAKGE